MQRASKRDIRKQAGGPMSVQSPYGFVESDGKNHKIWNLRRWMEKNFQFPGFVESMFQSINTPTGSGKTLFSQVLATLFLLTHPRWKVIFLTPKLIICGNYKRERRFKSESLKIEAKYPKPLHLYYESSKKMVRDILRFCLEDRKRLEDRIAVVTHAAFVRYYKYLERHNQLHLLENVYYIIDEAHHSQNHLFEDDEENEKGKGQKNGKNYLGAILEHLIDRSLQTNNIKILLATATPFRNNRLSIMRSDHEKLFVKYQFSFKEYLESTEHLKRFRSSIIAGDYNDNIQQLIEVDGVRKTCFFIPTVRSRYSKKPKQEYVLDLLSILSGRKITKIPPEDGNGMITIMRGDTPIHVIDLIKESDRDKKYAFIEECNREDSPNFKKIDVIIALETFFEGANYDPLDRVIIMGHRNSTTVMLQIYGRPARDMKGKEEFEIYHLLPQLRKDVDGEDLKEEVETYMKGLYISMIAECAIYPISIDIMNSRVQSGIRKIEAFETLRHMINEGEISEAIAMSIIPDLVNAMMLNGSTEKDPIDKHISVVQEILQRYDIEMEKGQIVAFTEEAIASLAVLASPYIDDQYNKKKSKSKNDDPIEEIEIVDEEDRGDYLHLMQGKRIEDRARVVRFDMMNCNNDFLPKLFVATTHADAHILERYQKLYSKIQYISFEEGKALVEKYGIKSRKEWVAFVKNYNNQIIQQKELEGSL